MDFLHSCAIVFGERTIKKISIIISDGDAQEYMSIDDFISQFCPDVKRVRCGWHIINRGWKAHLPNIKRIKNMTKYHMISMIQQVGHLQTQMQLEF